jgi:polyisoprenoid-binding protein YceI
MFKISHLGYSWLYGRFNDFDGSFTVDAENPENSSVQATIQVASLDSNHAERDKHLRGDDFLEVDEYPTATFKSTKIEKTGEKTAKITGDFTLHGVTKPVTLDAKLLGYGDDPWGGYRMGLEASTTLKLADFGITYDLGPASETVDIIISVEGVRQ